MTDVVADALVPAPPKRRLVRRILRVIGFILLGLVGFSLTVWSALAVYFTDLSGGSSPRRVVAALVLIVMCFSALFLRPRRYRIVAFTAVFLSVLIWFYSRTPSNTREWAADVVNVPSIEIAGDQMVVHNVRNFDYRSETDFTPRWEDRTYDLSKLRSLDFMLVYWGSKDIAHGIVTFCFDDDQYLAVSIETRKEKHESYSAVQGFFRQYELVYVFADERDVVRVRTNFRHEDVYLYRTNLPPEKVKALLLDYVRRANSLAREPEFYNALTSNCITNVVYSTRVINPSASLTLDTLLAGRTAQQLYRNKRIDTRLPFAELEARSHINETAVTIEPDNNYSVRIRQGLPIPAR